MYLIFDFANVSCWSERIFEINTNLYLNVNFIRALATEMVLSDLDPK